MNFLQRFELKNPSLVVDVTDFSALESTLEKICPPNRSGIIEIVREYVELGGSENLHEAGITVASAVTTCRIAHG